MYIHIHIFIYVYTYTLDDATFAAIIHIQYVYDDDDGYLDKLQTRGVKMHILYM
jgi:hypothetical protein